MENILDNVFEPYEDFPWEGSFPDHNIQHDFTPASRPNMAPSCSTVPCTATILPGVPCCTATPMLSCSVAWVAWATCMWETSA